MVSKDFHYQENSIMKKIFFLLTFLLLVFFGWGCPSNQISIFNGNDFSGWKLFVPDENVDVTTVWLVKDSVVHCKGSPNGYMRTEKDFSNYVLHLEWRWAERPGNSGVLLHMTGEDKVWPKSIECQLLSDNAGDFWLIDGTGITVDGKTIKSSGSPAHVPKKQPSNEKPTGQWNKYDIYCKDDMIECFVNGVLQNKGTDATVSKGKICLQSEDAPIEFRNIYITILK